jgi:hypothetical protein
MSNDLPTVLVASHRGRSCVASPAKLAPRQAIHARAQGLLYL